MKQIISFKSFIVTVIVVIILTSLGTWLFLDYVYITQRVTPDESEIPAKIEITEETKHELKVGEEFTIELPSNFTTGYTWNMPTGARDKRYIEWVTSKYIPDEPVREGSGGKEKMTFKALKSTNGMTLGLFLYNCQIWSGEIATIIKIPYLIK